MQAPEINPGESLGKILEGALDAARRPTPPQGGFFKLYRHRKQVRAYMDKALSTYGGARSKQFLIVAFGSAWREAVNRTYGIDPLEAALALVAMVLAAALERTIFPERKEVALFALTRGNRSEAVANHVLNVVGAVHSLSPYNRVPGMLVGYHAMAALMGLTEQERTDYVREQFLHHLSEADA